MEKADFPIETKQAWMYQATAALGVTLSQINEEIYRQGFIRQIRLTQLRNLVQELSNRNEELFDKELSR